MGRIIAIANQKGGVGKTTTAINLAASLAANDTSVLVVDVDPQGNCTTGLGIDKANVRHTLYHVLANVVPASEAILTTQMDSLSLLAADKNLIGANLELVDLPEREFLLRRCLQPVRDRYEFILLDCPPALDLLTLNAFLAADSVLIPLQCEFFALEGISQLVDTIEKVNSAFHHPLKIEGILLTMYDDRTNLAKLVADDLRQFFKEDVFNTVIPRSIRLAEAPSHGKPVILYDPRSKGAESYIRLAKEVVQHNKVASVQGTS